MRYALKNAAVITSASGQKIVQKYFKPPVFLSRVSEVGNPVKSSESTKMPAKQVSTTPDEWVDILSELKVSDKRALGKAFLQPQETRSVELACKWGTKVLNYVDHFANHAQTSTEGDLFLYECSKNLCGKQRQKRGWFIFPPKGGYLCT